MAKMKTGFGTGGTTSLFKGGVRHSGQSTPGTTPGHKLGKVAKGKNGAAPAAAKRPKVNLQATANGAKVTGTGLYNANF